MCFSRYFLDVGLGHFGRRDGREAFDPDDDPVLGPVADVFALDPGEHTGSDPDHVAPFQFFRTGVDQQNVFELAFGQRDEVVHLLVRNDQRHLGRLVVHALGRDQLGRLDFLKPRRRDSHEDQVVDGGLPADSAPSGLRRLLVVHRNETADTHSVELQLYLQFPVKGGLEYVPEPVRIAHRNLVVFEPSAGRKVVRRFGTGLRRIRTGASNIFVEIRIQTTLFAYLMRLYSGVCMSWHFAVSAADSCLFTARKSSLRIRTTKI